MAQQGNSHSSYEEALRRSSERIDNLQRSSRRASDMQQSLRYDDDDPRAARYTQDRTRRTIRLDDKRAGFGNAMPADSDDAWQGSSQYSRDPRSQNAYHNQQIENHGRNAGYRARPATFSTTAPAPFVSSRGLLVRAGICLVLLIVIIASIVRIGPTSGALSEAEASLQTQQEELNKLNSSNEDLQAQLDNMKTTIDQYNDLVAKS